MVTRNVSENFVAILSIVSLCCFVKSGIVLVVVWYRYHANTPATPNCPTSCTTVSEFISKPHARFLPAYANTINACQMLYEKTRQTVGEQTTAPVAQILVYFAGLLAVPAAVSTAANCTPRFHNCLDLLLGFPRSAPAPISGSALLGNDHFHTCLGPPIRLVD